ncbi:MAG: DUF3108 domain-containing protein, partial [Chitinispirillaceae bacterium]|nr:DUF3108 domain-containing protein [Chitinispirillaceae bacterium]
VLEPKLVTEKGAFNKKDKLEVWFTDDKLKRPVLIKSKIKVGSITARLINQTAAPVRKAPDKPAQPPVKTTPDTVPPAADPVILQDSTLPDPFPAAIDSNKATDAAAKPVPSDTSSPAK